MLPTEETPQGESLMNSFAARLKDISNFRVGGKPAFGKRHLAALAANGLPAMKSWRFCDCEVLACSMFV